MTSGSKNLDGENITTAKMVFFIKTNAAHARSYLIFSSNFFKDD